MRIGHPLHQTHPEETSSTLRPPSSQDEHDEFQAEPLPRHHVKDLLTHSDQLKNLCQGRQGSASDIARAAQAIAQIPDKQRGLLHDLCRGRKGFAWEIAWATQEFAQIPTEQRVLVHDLCQDREGYVSDIALATRVIAQIPAEQRNPALINFIKNLYQGREGSASNFANVAQDLARIPAEQRGAFIDTVSHLIQNRLGNGADVIGLIRVLREIPIELRNDRIQQVLTQERARYSISELTRTLLERSPAAANRINRADALQVHREAAIMMMPIYKFINEKLGNSPLLSLEESEKQINDWIHEADPSLFDQAAKDQMSGLLKIPKYQDALGVRFTDLGSNVDGQLLLRKAVTYCTQHPEHINHLLIQGLLDAARAYGNNSTPENASCVTGIAERFLLAFRDLVKASTLVEDTSKAVYNHPEYQKFLAMGDEDDEAADRIDWINKYKGQENIDALRAKIQDDLLALKPILEAEQTAVRGRNNAELAFETDTINRMFKIFDDPRNSPEEARLQKIWNAIQESLNHV